MAKTFQQQNSVAGEYNDNKYITDYNLYDVDNRIKSFDNCGDINKLSANTERAEILKQELGSAGFYYNHEIFKIKCFSCDYILNLKKGESPTAKHYLEKPRCHFLTSIRHDSPKMLLYLSFQKRMQTFRFWPAALKQKPEDMADAGLIYTGKADQVQCFFCGGKLSNWEENDDPSIEHAYWIPTCQFMIQRKGIYFIKSASCKREELKDKRRKALTEKKCDDEETSTVFHNHTCAVCYDKPVSVCFDPCGHVAVCDQCCFKSTRCPLCRLEITDILSINYG
ncbi:baculoviral IAP repeat-containing protein 7-B-like [Arctopsyche grandis]|uniref:baculoviral IAP repeat-containing protein 7-B-like n=1 Tax=Arctopsyche grandis TaxID=121162 RepID=UPI00406D8C23